jgi:hypothetical protein
MLSTYRYQRKALAMMLEKESGRIENPEFLPLWVHKVVEGGLIRLDSIRHHQHFGVFTNVLSSGTGTP